MSDSFSNRNVVSSLLQTQLYSSSYQQAAIYLFILLKLRQFNVRKPPVSSQSMNSSYAKAEISILLLSGVRLHLKMFTLSRAALQFKTLEAKYFSLFLRDHIFKRLTFKSGIVIFALHY